MQRMMHHSQSLYSSYFSGALANRMRDVMFFIPDLLKASIHSFYTNCLTIVFAMCSFYGVDSKFVYIFVLWATIYLTGLIILSTRARKMTEKVAAIRSTVLGSIVDILSNIMSVRLFSATKLESRSLKRVLDDGVAAEQDRDWRLLKLNAFQGTSFAIYQVICILLLIHGFKWGNVTPGLFVMILMLNNIVSDCLWDISEDISKLIDHIGNITQGLSIVLAPLDIKDHPHAGELKVSRGEIVFDQATFNYPEAEPFFDKLSIVIKPGQKVGLVGYSGGGKTTFVSLILRLHDVVSGRILIDGQDIRDVTQESLRHAVAMIPQDSILFHRSLMENIRYGCKDATNEEVMEVSKRAHVHDFAVRLSNGYNYMVGERGMKLSGGQRQRIALARAMLKKAPILILDEATSQLDAITEGEIQNVLLDLMQGKTTLVIAHRLSTLLHMDRILVFKHGSIVEDGTHQELIARKGHYKDLWDAQFHGILPETNGNSVSR